MMKTCQNCNATCNDSQKFCAICGTALLPTPSAQPMQYQQTGCQQPVSDQPYTGQPYTGQPYTDQPYTGQPYTNQPYTGQPYTNQPYTGQPYTDQPYTGQPFAPEKKRQSGKFNGKRFVAVFKDPKLKNFILQYGSEKYKKNIKTTWVFLYVSAALTLILSIVFQTFSIDAFVIAGIALWMQMTYSRFSAYTTVAYFAVSAIVSIVTSGVPVGWLALVVGIWASRMLTKADKYYQSYVSTGVVPQEIMKQ